MAQHYSSFLLRCWHLDGDEQRIKVEHVQSGEVIQVTTLTQAMAWIKTYCGEGSSPASGSEPEVRKYTSTGSRETIASNRDPPLLEWEQRAAVDARADQESHR